MMIHTTCSLPTCDNQTKRTSSDYCSASCSGRAKVNTPEDILSRFDTQEHDDFDSPCQIWTGTTINSGYGRASLKGKKILVHRLAWIHANGDIPENLQVDHLCRVRLCCNTEHLRLVTSRENTLCGDSVAAWNSKKTHCREGHALVAGNLTKPGMNRNQRICQICSTEYHRQYYLRKKQTSSKTTTKVEG